MAVIKYKVSDGVYAPITNYEVQPIVPVSGTGTSMTDVMSQWAVTNELDKKPNKNHKHGSDAISALTNYSGAAASYSEITSSDDLNTAIGKLVKGLESATSSGVSSVSIESATSGSDYAIKLSVNGQVQDTVVIPTGNNVEVESSGTSDNIWYTIKINNNPVAIVSGQPHKHNKSDINNFDSEVESIINNKAVTSVELKSSGDTNVVKLFVNNEISGSAASTSHTHSASTLDGFASDVQNEIATSTTITQINNSISGINVTLESKAEKNHKHTSNDIETLSGYTGAAASYTMITSGDSLNTAIGKLVKGLSDASSSGGVVSVGIASGTSGDDFAITLSVNGLLQDTVVIPTGSSNSIIFSQTGTSGSDEWYEVKVNGNPVANVAGKPHKHNKSDINNFDSEVENIINNKAVTSVKLESSGNTDVVDLLVNGAISGSAASTSHSHRANTLSGFSTDVESVIATSTTITQINNTLGNKADSNHKHGSDAITALTNYTGAAASYSVITSSDDLNTAIGKLVKGLESATSGGVSTVSIASGKSGDDNVINLSVNGSLQDTVVIGDKVIFSQTGTSGSDEWYEVKVNGNPVANVAGKPHKHNKSDINNFDSEVESIINNKAVTSVKLESSGNTDVVNLLVNNSISGSAASTSHSHRANTLSGFSTDVESVIATSTTITQINTTLGNKADKGHKHDSDAISAFTNYSGAAASYTMITSGDSLNVAIGKLEKGIIDSNDELSGLTDTVNNNTTDISTISAITSFITGSNTANTLSNIPTTKRLVVATISNASAINNVSLSGNSLPNGYEIHVIVKNNSGSDFSIILPNSSPYVAVVSSIDVPASGYGELNFISDGTNIYVRGE